MLKEFSEISLQKYLNKNEIAIDVTKYINLINKDLKPFSEVNENLFDNIIVDGYNGFSEDVKDISNEITLNFKIYLGRKEKKILKNILDYENYNLVKLLGFNSKISKAVIELCKETRKKNYKNVLSSKDEYFTNLETAIIENNDDRVSDYLNFLYSKALIHNEFCKKSIYDIYCENAISLKKETNSDANERLKEICSLNKKKINYPEAVELFNKIYQEEVLYNGKKLNELIGLELNQSFFDNFKNKEEFLSYTFELLKILHSNIQNHRTLAIKINNINYKGVNIKWELYSYLTIYAEFFIEYIENRQYFKPEEICIDLLEHKYNFVASEKLKNQLKLYFSEKIIFSEISELKEFKITQKEIDFFKKVHNGFQFIDCIILKSKNSFENSKEVDFIENNNELLLIFSKHEIDDRKIPCPVCGSLSISGNSYPAVGIKSWECKNNLCSERSKTNRGKRYSSRSNDMQSGVYTEDEANLISKDLITKWRKDIVSESASESLLEMLIKYFSYKEGSILLLNFNSKEYQIPSELNKCRNIIFNKIENIFSLSKFNKSTYSNFLSSDYLSKFIYVPNFKSNTKKIDFNKIDNYKIYNSDCLTFLNSIPENSIDHMVTSPPYYNAREYSQWKNLYNYLNDMYKICIASYAALKPGAVFFYNIGDIFDNPNTIVKSKMGEKRVALGSFLILLFRQAGFELLDNVIWDKGETQSNRHKNDGNFTPYYQRPANCYEHMFIFKKPGKLILNSIPAIKENIQKFSPVIKINSKGENLFGHTAPYPPDLPLMSINTFTKKGAVVYDPFLGSGTSVYVAVKNGRKGLGTEMDANYFKLASANIIKKIDEINQSTLF